MNTLIHVRLDEPGIAAVDRASDKAGVNRSELVRAALREMGVEIPLTIDTDSREVALSVKGLTFTTRRSRGRTWRVIQGGGEGEVKRIIARRRVLSNARTQGRCWDDFYGGFIRHEQVTDRASESARRLLLYSARVAAGQANNLDWKSLSEAVAEAEEAFEDVGKIFTERRPA